MSEPVPPAWGTVVGRFAAVVADGVDPNLSPDLIPLLGTVTLTAQAPSVRLVQPDTPVTLVTTPIECTIDATGTLIGPDGGVGVRVMASNAHGMSPTGVQYRATFNLVDPATGWPMEPQPAAFLFTVPVDGVVDLADVMPQAATPPYLEVVSYADRDAAAMAALQARAARDEAEAIADEVDAALAGAVEAAVQAATDAVREEAARVATEAATEAIDQALTLPDLTAIYETELSR